MPFKKKSSIENSVAHESEVDAELHRIYDPESESEEQDMTRLDQVDHSFVKKVLVGMMVFFAVLAAISWAGFFFFSPQKEKFAGEKVSVTVEGPSEVKSGEVTTYAVHWKNDENVALGTAKLELRLPKNFTVTKTDPSTENTTWQIGSVASGHDGLVTIQGVSLAPLDKAMDLQAILTYRPADFNSEFQKVATRTVTIKDSVVELEVKGPTKILPGDKVALTLAYHNNSSNDFKNIHVRAIWPDNFIPDSSTPDSTDTTLKEWVIVDLPGNARGTIAVNGSFASSAEGKIDLRGQVGFLDQSAQFQLQRETVFTTTVLKGDLVTTLLLNGKADDQPIHFGDTLRYALSYKNTGSVKLEDVSLSAVFETTPADKVLRWNDLKDKAGGVRKGNTITWTKRQVPSLANIDAGEGGTLDIELPILAEPLASSKDATYQVTAYLQADVVRIDGDKVNRSAKTAPVIAKVVSDARLSAQAQFFNKDGIPVGSGPLPPQVGKETTYRVMWKIDNSLHELTSLKLSTKLSPGVVWTGLSSTDAGDLKFDAGNNKMIWTLNWMPTTIKTLNVSFDIKLSPTDDQRGDVPNLIDSTIFEAVDKVTSDALLLSQAPLTTALVGDDLAAGKGKVQ